MKGGSSALSVFIMKYLFSYFLGNEPDEERVCLALSEDGYHFKPLNGNNPVIVQTTGTKCCRDPFIIRDINGGFYMIATDMKSSDGWCSNHGVVSWHSDDLINWTDETAVDFHIYPETENADKIWAPEALYDKSKGEYFVYYSAYNVGGEIPLSIWYSYTKDFKTYTNPKPLFAPSSGLDAIDADITEKGGRFYMYYKDECNKTICVVVSDKLDGEYKEPENNKVALTDKNVEGCCMYKVGDDYILIMDMYSDGKYLMQKTRDMFNFEVVEDYDLSFHPRHGSVIQISDEEYERLIKYYES